MNLAALLSPPTVHALGWTLLHSLWQGALLALGLALLLLLAPRASARARYATGIMMLAVMVVAAAITFWKSYSVSDAAPTAATMQPATQAGFGAETTKTAGEGKPSPAWMERAGAFFSGYFDRHLPLLVALWLLGVLFLTLRLAGGLLFLQRLKSRQLQPLPAPWPERTAALCGRCGVRRSVAVWESLRAKTPLIVGCLKPVVLLPVGMLAGMAPQQVEALLAHELAHIARHDYLVNALQTLVDILFFFHPGLRWISAQVRLERENCCDDIAVSLGGDSLDYARALADLHDRQSWKPEPALAALGRPHQLFGRIRRLLNRPAGGSDFQAGFLGAVMLIACLLALLKLPSLASAATGPAILSDPRAAQETASDAEPRSWGAFDARTFILEREAEVILDGAITSLPDSRLLSWVMRADTARVVWAKKNELKRLSGRYEFSEKVRLPAGQYIWIHPSGGSLSVRLAGAPGGETLPLQPLAGPEPDRKAPLGSAPAENRELRPDDRLRSIRERELQQEMVMLQMKRDLEEKARLAEEEKRQAGQSAGQIEASEQAKLEQLRRVMEEKAAQEAAAAGQAAEAGQKRELEIALREELDRSRQEKLQQAKKVKESERKLRLILEKEKADQQKLAQEYLLQEARLRQEAAQAAALRLQEETRRAQELEAQAKAMEAGWQKIREELLKDRLIEPGRDPEIRFVDDALYVDGRKLPADLSAKYRKLFEAATRFSVSEAK